MLVTTMMTGHCEGNHMMDRLRWQRGMRQERACMAMPAGGSTHIFLEGTNRRANWPVSAGACTEREMQRQSGEARGQEG